MIKSKTSFNLRMLKNNVEDHIVKQISKLEIVCKK